MWDRSVSGSSLSISLHGAAAGSKVSISRMSSCNDGQSGLDTTEDSVRSAKKGCGST